ncbi:hypothetical protein ACFYNZ_01980 [Streptomyces kebangsaanensis]|uniref:Sulfur globule protein n=1 Tax=Streptomyces kebangsaanensis TaxID=864058 RepID=A0ABW6KLH2_9ACTN
MKAQRARRLFAMSAAGVLLAGGAAIGAAGTASAATPAHVSTSVGHGGGCYYGGWWSGYCGGFGRGGFFPYGYGYGYNSPVVIVVR